MFNQVEVSEEQAFMGEVKASKKNLSLFVQNDDK